MSVSDLKRRSSFGYFRDLLVSLKYTMVLVLRPSADISSLFDRAHRMHALVCLRCRQELKTLFCHYRVRTSVNAKEDTFLHGCEPSGWIDYEAVRILVHDFPVLRNLCGGRARDPHLQRLVRLVLRSVKPACSLKQNECAGCHRWHTSCALGLEIY